MGLMLGACPPPLSLLPLAASVSTNRINRPWQVKARALDPKGAKLQGPGNPFRASRTYFWEGRRGDGYGGPAATHRKNDRSVVDQLNPVCFQPDQTDTLHRRVESSLKRQRPEPRGWAIGRRGRFTVVLPCLASHHPFQPRGSTETRAVDAWTSFSEVTAGRDGRG
jgi:hypothetical protein